MNLESMGQEELLTFERNDQDASMTFDRGTGSSALGGFPFEPPAPDQADIDADRNFRELLNFHLYGKRPAGTPQAPPGDTPVPALLHPYIDLSSVRHDYPACLGAGEGDQAVVPLTRLIDDLIGKTAREGEEGERTRRHLLQQESVMRMLQEQHPDCSLLGLWDLAAGSLVSASDLDKEKLGTLRENLATARRQIGADLEFLACDAAAAPRLLRTIATSHWRARCREWAGNLDRLIHDLQDILDADFSRSPEARSPERLSKSTGVTGGEIDFQALSSILNAGRSDDRLPAERRERIETVLATLQRFQPVFRLRKDDSTALPFPIPCLVEDSSAAREYGRTLTESMVEFFRAVSIGRLETGNFYQVPEHDEYFAGYDASYLSREEQALCPPVLLHLRSSAVSTDDLGGIMELLSSISPVKVLLEVDDLCLDDGTSSQPLPLIGWPGRMGGMAMSLNHAYVLQAPVSNLPMLCAGITQGLDYEGPALYCVYVGNGDDRPGVPRYLDAASCTESRCFPAFTYHPGRGDTLAERIDIAGNPNSDKAWTGEEFSYRRADGTEAGTELAFTPADSLYNDRRLAAHFWNVPMQGWHQSMLPAHEYLQLDPNLARLRIPFLLTVDREGLLGRVVISRRVIGAARQCAAFWRNLQELGGINNSYVIDQVAREKARLEEAKQREIAAIEEQYTVQLDRDLGKLTEEIIGRIATQLIADTGGMAALPRAAAVTAAAVPAAAPAAPAEDATPAPAAATEEEDEEVTSLDEAWIETPRCTTCDECTKLNGLIFAYNENKQATIKDAAAGPYKDLVRAAELCPVKIIHPGKPLNESEPNLEDLKKRAEPFL